MIHNIDCLEGMKDMEDNSVSCFVTSPPYNKKGLLGRVTPTGQAWSKFQIDYNTYGDDMVEEEYQAWMIAVLDEMYRVLKPDGSIFFNHKPRRHKNRAYLPWDFIGRSKCNLYQLIVWNRRNSPNIRKDILVPCTEHVYWLCKDKPKTYRDAVSPDFLTEVWDISPGRQGEHPAPFPEQLVENAVRLSTVEGDLVCDPFMGSGTTAVVCERLNREWVGFEMDEFYTRVTLDKVAQDGVHKTGFELLY